MSLTSSASPAVTVQDGNKKSAKSIATKLSASAESVYSNDFNRTTSSHYDVLVDDSRVTVLIGDAAVCNMPKHAALSTS